MDYLLKAIKTLGLYMNTNLIRFCKLVKNRSEEHLKTIELLNENELYGQMVSILRQELDSLIRVLFLLTKNIDERNHFIEQTFKGYQWKINGQRICDKQMINISLKLCGWANYVYKFGCSFIHLSIFCDYENIDPFDFLSMKDKENIKEYLIQYHDYPQDVVLNINSIKPYILPIFNKIKGNLYCYIEHLENEDLFERLY